MIIGIPYFGENTQELTETILKSSINKEIKYSSIYDMIKSNIYKRLVVVIDNKWLSWFKDITFDYKGRNCYIPYFTYEYFKDNTKDYISNNKGHLVVNDKAAMIRYNYTYCKCNINIDKLSIIVYDLDTNEKYKLTTNKWFNEREFSIDKLYKLYINSSFREDDNLITNNSINYIGYHLILVSPKNFNNAEKKIRNQLGLEHITNYNDIDTDYRDVRQFRKEEVIRKIGLITTDEPYKIRRLRFESYLFCVLRQECTPIETKFKKSWDDLGVTRDYIKYGKDIKLIIKSYWLNNFKEIKETTWSRR